MILVKVMTVYKYIFYKLFRWSQIANGESQFHELNAIIMLSFVMMLNLASLPFMIQLLTGYEALKIFSGSNFFGPVIGIMMFALNLYFLKYRIGVKNIIGEFGNESNEKGKLGSILVICYAAGSLLTLFVLGWAIFLK